MVCSIHQNLLLCVDYSLHSQIWIKYSWPTWAFIDPSVLSFVKDGGKRESSLSHSKIRWLWWWLILTQRQVGCSHCSLGYWWAFCLSLATPDYEKVLYLNYFLCIRQFLTILSVRSLTIPKTFLCIMRQILSCSPLNDNCRVDIWLILLLAEFSVKSSFLKIISCLTHTFIVLFRN